MERVRQLERGTTEQKMVVVHVKVEGEEERQFLYECPCGSTIDELAHAVLEISGLQSNILKLSHLLRSRFLTDAFRESCPEVALSVDRALSEAEAYVSKDQVSYKRTLSPHALRDHIQCIEKEVRFAESRGLLDLNLPQIISDYELHKGTQLWWAGKELLRGTRLSDYIGGNEKTKIAIKLHPTCS